ncbi:MULTISPECIES: hypothetical protein [Streptomyces]|uniref:hypothetical protein n=1 Tax=Streptomyces TaxID=1883 RepID=UPI0026B5F8AF
MSETERTERTERRDGGRLDLNHGPGRLLVLLYGVFAVGAASRSAYQLSTRFDEAPVAYLLSAVAAVVYAVITFCLARGGERARRVGLVCCAAELVGVLTVGTWSLVDPGAFPDATVWSDYGIGYVFFPLILPLTGLRWFRWRGASGAPAAPVAPPAREG